MQAYFNVLSCNYLEGLVREVCIYKIAQTEYVSLLVSKKKVGEAFRFSESRGLKSKIVPTRRHNLLS